MNHSDTAPLDTTAARTGTAVPDDFYARMLPPRDERHEALGGMLNGLGIGMGVVSMFAWPVLLGIFAVLLTGTSLPMARSRAVSQRFGVGFAIATATWLLGISWASITGGALWP